MISQNISLNSFKVSAQSETLKTYLYTLIDIKNSNLIISGDEGNKFTLRNRYDLQIVKTVEHDFGYLYCGL